MTNEKRTEEDRIIKLVKEIGNDIKLYADFLSKLAGFIYLTTNSKDLKTNGETHYKDVIIKWEFNFKARKKHDTQAHRIHP